MAISTVLEELLKRANDQNIPPDLFNSLDVKEFLSAAQEIASQESRSVGHEKLVSFFDLGQKIPFKIVHKNLDIIESFKTESEHIHNLISLLYSTVMKVGEDMRADS